MPVITTREDPLTSEMPLRRHTPRKSKFKGVFQITPTRKYVGVFVSVIAFGSFSWIVIPSDRRNVFIKLAVAHQPKVIDALPRTKVSLDLIAGK